MGVDLGKRLVFLREGLGLSQRELSRRTGLNRVTIANAENGLSVPNRGSLAILASALGSSIEYLRGEELSLGVRVRLLRDKLGLTQEEFAARCGLSRPTISYVEHGRTVPQESTLVVMARVLGTTVGALKGEEALEVDVETPGVYLRPEIAVVCDRCGVVETVTDWLKAELIRVRHAVPHPSLGNPGHRR